ncbi:CDP-diacylglycerol--glycerol-3-phosphate 3-phosphatidyltransferase [Erysipelothrix sp. HDW6A]|uniref:CDP-diacylglycerol--glycerol-3-phosphate 3-phosphatidyltransferase n=1 Tax=Erysipelothrix sp. HDW6A TaxID=2714928 RepID=UPI001407A598|nr:CDP-diacylglycerol--glycerol-3-phosphate 3-phosphatidyltransferase [Erysipelothrix sp. HDW6A]QIK57569.1 CDP-diacylglycerol--glycerol-3-phosphate 3-phosphatidyltransferase [Erysipelothrix sp. HDW6A]
MNIANKLTVFRIILIPVIVLVELFPYEQFGIQIPYFVIEHITLSLKNIIVLVLFATAAITDFIDGYLARKYDMITVFGKFLDPIADKLLVNTLFIIFAFRGTVPVVAVLLMIWRDTIVDAVRMLVSQKGLVMAAGYLGKVKTVAQMIAIILILMNNLPFELFSIPLSTILVWFATLMSVMSGASYVIQARSYLVESM